MSALDPGRSAALKRLFASVSDDILAILDAALTTGARDSAAALVASSHSGAERMDRAARDEVFAPLLPLTRPAPVGGVDPAAEARPAFDPVPEIWRVLRRTEAAAVDAVVAAVRDRDEPGAGRAAADALLLRASRLLREGAPGWEGLRARLAGPAGDGTERLADVLELGPVIREVGFRAQALARAPSGAHAAALKLAFRDVQARRPDCGRLLLSALSAHLDRPWQVMRLVSAVMDRPGDAYVAGSELAPFGLAVLDDVDARIARIRAFSGDSGVEGGAGMGEVTLTATLEVVELEQSLRLNADGLWARRVAGQKRDLAAAVENRLRQAGQAVERALPVGDPQVKRRVRGAPRLDGGLDPLAAQRALSFLAFLDATRASAGFGGFGAVRSRLLEELDGRLDAYAEDLLELLRSGAGADPTGSARERLRFTADCLGLVREPRAADLLLRRAAAA